MTGDQGDEDAAGRCYRESLAAFRQVGERYGTARALEGLARAAGASGEAQRAAQLYAAAAALRETLGVAAVRACLGEEGFAAAWAEGQARSLHAVVALAMEDDSSRESSMNTEYPADDQLRRPLDG
jgi:hypothetical protein